jgi:phage terminase small subunit
MGRAARVTPEGLTLKEEQFCLEYFANRGNGEAAYRASYNTKADRGGGWIRAEVVRLLDKAHILNRIRMLQERAAIKYVYDVDRAMRETDEGLQMARETKNPAAVASLVRLRAQLTGNLVERSEVTRKTLRDVPKEDVEEALMRAAKEAGYVIERAQEKASEEPEKS